MAVGASAATGCGGGGDSGPTKAEFIKRADAICERADKAQGAALRAYEEKRPRARLTRSSEEEVALSAGLPPIRAEAKELSELATPSGDEDRIKEIIDELEKAVEQADKNPSGLLRESSLKPFAAVGKLARAYGLKACATPA